MDRFKIALKKDPPRRSKSTRPKKEVSKKIGHFSFLDGTITLTDNEGNLIEGFVQDFQIEENRPVTTINSFNGPIGMIPGRSETRINMSLIVDKMVASSLKKG